MSTWSGETWTECQASWSNDTMPQVAIKIAAPDKCENAAAPQTRPSTSLPTQTSFTTSSPSNRCARLRLFCPRMLLSLFRVHPDCTGPGPGSRVYAAPDPVQDLGFMLHWTRSRISGFMHPPALSFRRKQRWISLLCLVFSTINTRWEPLSRKRE